MKVGEDIFGDLMPMGTVGPVRTSGLRWTDKCFKNNKNKLFLTFVGNKNFSYYG